MGVDGGVTPGVLLPGAAAHSLVLSVQLGRAWGSGEPPPGESSPHKTRAWFSA